MQPDEKIERSSVVPKVHEGTRYMGRKHASPARATQMQHHLDQRSNSLSHLLSKALSADQ